MNELKLIILFLFLLLIVSNILSYFLGISVGKILGNLDNMNKGIRKMEKTTKKMNDILKQ